MAKNRFTPVFASTFTPPPEPAGGYSRPDHSTGGERGICEFHPWRSYKFTGKFEDKDLYERKHPDDVDDGELPMMSPEQLEAYHFIREFMRGHHVREAELPEEVFNVERKDWRRFMGRVMILTGAAGCGKSVLVKWIRDTLGCSICATTGSAAMLVGGTTIDLMFAFKRSTWEVSTYLDKSMRAAADVIVVDEASMIGHHMAEMVENALDLYPQKKVILVGDWAQASPVKDDWPFSSALFRCAEVVGLSKCYRQSDAEYLEALNELRSGSLSQYFERCVSIPPGIDDPMLCMYATNREAAERNEIMFRRWMEKSGEKPIKMWATISTASTSSSFIPINPDRIAEVAKSGKRISYEDGEPGYLNSVETWREGGIPDWKSGKLYQDSKMAHDMEFCIGARVLITRNAPISYRSGVDQERDYVNGDLGTIVSLPDFVAKHKELPLPSRDSAPPAADSPEGAAAEEEDAPKTFMVRLDRNDKLVTIQPACAEMYDAYVGKRPNPNVRVIGYPVQLGWAVTIHKSQGMTLPSAFVSLSSIRRMPTKHGLAYVALSRTRDSSTLRIDCADYGVASRDAAINGLV